MEVLAASIYAFCAINAKQILVDKNENQRVCWEVLINCSVEKNGNFTKEKLDKCQEAYKSIP